LEPNNKTEDSSKFVLNNLTIYSSNGEASIVENQIDIDYECSSFYLNGEPNAKFKHLIDLLEFLIDEKLVFILIYIYSKTYLPYNKTEIT
jgi:hypothetical protein